MNIHKDDDRRTWYASGEAADERVQQPLDIVSH
jgi:hypothetical protein